MGSMKDEEYMTKLNGPDMLVEMKQEMQVINKTLKAAQDR